jgi:hypothetical protein
MRIGTFLTAVLFCTPGLSYAQGGYAHGADHCYYFEPPVGWQMDNQAAATNGVPMVFFPEGTTWQSAEVVMYTRPSPQLRPGAESIKAQVADVIAMYRSASEKITAVPNEQVHAKAGAQGQLWSYSGYRNGGSELAVYFLGRNTVNYFVAQVPRGASLKQAKQNLLTLASSYREATDCKPCAEAACKH